MSLPENLVIRYGMQGGHYFPRDPEPEPLIDKNTFYTHCKLVASKLKMICKVLTFDELGYTSFSAVRFEKQKEGLVYALFNDYVVAFVKVTECEEEIPFPMTFINCNKLKEYFEEEFYVVTEDALNQPFNIEDHPEINQLKTVRDQVKYWQPRTVGDVIFNYWD